MTTTTAEQTKNDGLMVAIFHKFKWWLLFASALAGIISVIYTVKFNTAQATAQEDQLLLAITGVVQDSAEYPFIAIGLIMAWMASSWFYRIAGLVMAGTGITLLLWSIAATFGSNNAIIGESVARTELAEKQMKLVEQVVANTSSTAATMQANADAARAKAQTYSSKFNRRASEQIVVAQGHAEKAAVENDKALQALDSMDKIDQDALTQRNSAVELFKKMAVFLGVEESTVENAFLLTRASQLEIITSIGVLVTVLILLAQWRNAPEPQSPNSQTKTRCNNNQCKNYVEEKQEDGSSNCKRFSECYNEQTNRFQYLKTSEKSTPNQGKSGVMPVVGAGVSMPITGDGDPSLGVGAGVLKPIGSAFSGGQGTSTLKKAKDAVTRGAEKGMEAGLEKGAYAASKFVAEANSTAPARQQAASNFAANKLEAAQAKVTGRKPRQKNNAELMKTALLPEFREIGIKVISGQIKPVHNQISKKLKLATPQKSLNILNLLEALSWIYQKQDRTRHLEKQHQPTGKALPLSPQQATQEIDQIIQYVKTKLGEKHA